MALPPYRPDVISDGDDPSYVDHADAEDDTRSTGSDRSWRARIPTGATAVLAALAVGAVAGAAATSTWRDRQDRARSESALTLDVTLQGGSVRDAGQHVIALDLRVRNLGPLPVELASVSAQTRGAGLEDWEPGAGAEVPPGPEGRPLRLRFRLDCRQGGLVMPRIDLRVRTADGHERAVQPEVEGLAERWAGEAGWRCGPAPLTLEVQYDGGLASGPGRTLRVPLDVLNIRTDQGTIVLNRIGVPVPGTTSTIEGPAPVTAAPGRPSPVRVRVDVVNCAAAAGAQPSSVDVVGHVQSWRTRRAPEDEAATVPVPGLGEDVRAAVARACS